MQMQNSNQANLCRHLHDAAQNTPDALAVAVQKKKFGKFSYNEINFTALNKYSDNIAYAFNEYGLKAGDKAVLMVTPSIDFFAITFALFKAGIVPILVDPGMGTKNLKQCFVESQPDIFIAIPKAQFAKRLFAWGKKTIKHNITVGSSIFGGKSLKSLLRSHPTEQAYPMVKMNSQEMAAILFTSGSTGTPKGVVYSHAMFEAQISVLKNDYQIKPGERDLSTFPLFALFGPALGMASIVPDMDASKPITAKPPHIFAAIKKYQCTNLFANPALIDILSRSSVGIPSNLNSLKRIISAGAPATFSAIQRFAKGLRNDVPIITSYGATESLPISKINSQALLQTELLTENGNGICVGVPVEGISVSIIAITEESINTWQPSLKLAENQIGEIVVQGPQVSERYYNRAQATEQAKIQNGNEIMHRMGDLGYFDEQGKLWMCGRKAHRVESIVPDQTKTFYSIPCERIFNTHPEIKRTALVPVEENGKKLPLICIELEDSLSGSSLKLFNELQLIAERHPETAGIKHFLIHTGFPMDVRHNAKIFREKLALWAQNKMNK